MKCYIPFKVLRCQNEHCSDKATHKVQGSLRPVFCERHYKFYIKLLTAERIKAGFLDQ